ncbi:nuclear export mediator factor NEMF [Tanacetum coccineum]
MFYDLSPLYDHAGKAVVTVKGNGSMALILDVNNSYGGYDDSMSNENKEEEANDGAPFDATSLDNMRRLVDHAGVVGHIYPLAILCHDIMPPPQSAGRPKVIEEEPQREVVIAGDELNSVAGDEAGQERANGRRGYDDDTLNDVDKIAMGEDDIKEIGEDEKEKFTNVDYLTRNPLSNGILLYAMPVCAPYTALQSYKYHFKIIPRTTKKGKELFWNAMGLLLEVVYSVYCYIGAQNGSKVT